MGGSARGRDHPNKSFEKNTGETSGGSLVQRQEDALMVPNPTENSRGGHASRENSGRLADVKNISLRIVSVRSNTGETSGSSLVQRQKDALMVPNPRENSRGGRASRESSGRLADVEKISPRIVSVQSNTGETPGSSLVQRQEDALMVPNPRENSQGGRASRESSGRRADVENISPRIASVRSSTRETSDGRPLQRQKGTLMVPNPRENSRGGRASRESSGRLADVEMISPRIVFVRANTGETSGSSLVQRQKDALMVPNPRENSRGGRASRESSGRLADVEMISPRIVSVQSNTRKTPDSKPLQRQKDVLVVPNPREISRGGHASRESFGRMADAKKISPRIVSVRSNTGETSNSSLVQRQTVALMVPNPRENLRGGRASRENSGSWRMWK